MIKNIKSNKLKQHFLKITMGKRETRLLYYDFMYILQMQHKETTSTDKEK